jgi:hypothetical protein
VRLRDIAASLDITEPSAFGIISDLGRGRLRSPIRSARSVPARAGADGESSCAQKICLQTACAVPSESAASLASADGRIGEIVIDQERQARYDGTGPFPGRAGMAPTSL